MSLAAFAAAGYAPVPLRGGRPAVAGIFSNNPSWRHAHGEDVRFAGCDVGILCSSRPLSGASGAATLGAVSSTWVAGVRWETTDRKLSAEISAAIEQVGGTGPTRIEGAETLRVFRVDKPLAVRRLAPQYLPKERHTALSYRPHRFEILSLASWLNVSGGKWLNGAVPDTKRDELPSLTRDQSDAITCEVQRVFNQRGAMPWT